MTQWVVPSQQKGHVVEELAGRVQRAGIGWFQFSFEYPEFEEDIQVDTG